MLAGRPPEHAAPVAPVGAGPGGGRSRRAPARAALVVLSIALYVTASRALGEQYPFGPLSMFSGGLRVSSRIVARAPDGRVCELSSFVGWRCPGPVDFRASANPQCRTQAEHAEVDRKAETAIVASPASEREGEPVVVIRRIFNVPQADGPVVVEDCALVSCSATEVPGTCRPTP